MVVVKQLRLLVSCSALLLVVAGCGDTASTGSGGTSQAIPDTTHTRIGTLTYEAGFPTPDTITKLYDELDFQRAVLGHQISDNLVSFYSMHVGPNEAIEGAHMGDLVVWENFLDPKGIVLTGNDTTIYGLAFLDLKRNGPMVVEVPPSPFLGSLLDLWQVPIVGIDAKGGKFVVAAEDDESKIQVPEGMMLVRSKTRLAVFFARGLVVDNDTEGAAKTVTDCKVYPLSKVGSPPPTRTRKATGVVMDTISPMDPMTYWARVAEVADMVNPEVDEDASLMLSLLKPLGIEQGKPFKPTDRQKKLLKEAAHFGWLMAQAISYAPRMEGITYYPDTQWEWVLELDPSLRSRFWRDLEARTNYYFAASMAQPAMKTKAIGKGSQYLRSARDSNGEWLDGAKRYRLRVPKNPPAKLFWSVTLHDVQTRSQVQNKTNNAALSAYDKLNKNADGSVDLYFGPEAPDGFESNWVQTIPGRGWWVWFRFYGPTEPFFDKSWQLPDFERLK